MTETATGTETLLTHDGRPAADLWPQTAYVHLNHGSFGRVTTAAHQRQQELAVEMETSTLRFLAGVHRRIADARAELAPWLQVPAERMALVPNASGGVSAALYSMPLPLGSEVVVTEHAYGAVRMAVDRAARMAGAQVVVAAVPLEADAAAAEEAVWAQVNDRTAMMVLDQITSPTARMLPVGAICARARAAGIATIVDGAHAPLLLPDPVNDASADVWVGNLHKFAATPRGTAALVAHPDVADQLYPLIDSWGAKLAFPDRFDHQGSDDYTAWLTAPFSIQDLADQLGWDRIRAHATAVADQAVRQIGAVLAERYDYDPSVDVGQPLGPIRLVELPAVTAGDPGHGCRDAFLDAGFEAAFTGYGDRVFWRVSPHAYTTQADLDAFVDRGLPLLPPPA